MAGFNLIRKRRRRLPVKKILLGVLAVTVVGAGVYLGATLMGKKPFGKSEDVNLTISDVSFMSFYQESPEGPGYEYNAPGEGEPFARGAVATFSVLSHSTVQGQVKLDNLGVVVKSFKPLEAMPEKVSYEPPFVRTEVPESDDDAVVRLKLAEGEKSTVTWTAQNFPVPEGTVEVVPEETKTKAKERIVYMTTSPIDTPLSSLNRSEVRFFVVRVLLETPGVAELAIVAKYDEEGKEGWTMSEKSFSVAFDPASDVGSVAFHQRVFERDPTFQNARAYRDKLLDAKELDKVVPAAEEYRNREPGADADWLVGSSYKALGDVEGDPARQKELWQKASCNGLIAFYRQDQDFPGDRLTRWQEAKDWLTEKVQSKVISLECP